MLVFRPQHKRHFGTSRVIYLFREDSYFLKKENLRFYIFKNFFECNKLFSHLFHDNDNIKMDFQELRWDVDWIDTARDR
jgi:hypothetical protein